MVDFNGLLQRKYDILEQDARTRATASDAEANLANVRAGQLPADSAAQRGLLGAQAAHTAEQARTVAPLAQAQIGLTGAQVGLTNSQAAHTDATTGMVAPIASAQIGYQDAMSVEADARAKGQQLATRIGSAPDPDGTLQLMLQHGGFGQPKPATSALSLPSYATTPGMAFADGTSTVPGQGDGTVDTVDAKLAPGEAVINHEGAELVGRDTIEAINSLGLAHRAAKAGAGMVSPKSTKTPASKDDRAKGYNKGTAKVPEKPAAKAAGKPKAGKGMSPAPGGAPAAGGAGAGLLAALAQMSGGRPAA